MFIYNSLPGLHHPVFCQLSCQSRLIQSRISERREPFPSTPPNVFLIKRKAQKEESWSLTEESGGRVLLQPAWAGKLVSEQQLDSGDAQHTLPTGCVCFCGVKEIWSPPMYKTHIPHPPITTMKNEESYGGSLPRAGIIDTLVIRIINTKSKNGKGHILPECWMLSSYHRSLLYRQKVTNQQKFRWHAESLVNPRLNAAYIELKALFH